MPTSLGELRGFRDEHIDRAVEAASDPQLEMKLKAMPAPMDAAAVEEYMRPTLEAAAAGRFEDVPTLPV